MVNVGVTGPNGQYGVGAGTNDEGGAYAGAWGSEGGSFNFTYQSNGDGTGGKVEYDVNNPDGTSTTQTLGTISHDESGTTYQGENGANVSRSNDGAGTATWTNNNTGESIDVAHTWDSETNTLTTTGPNGNSINVGGTVGEGVTFSVNDNAGVTVQNDAENQALTITDNETGATTSLGYNVTYDEVNDAYMLQFTGENTTVQPTVDPVEVPPTVDPVEPPSSSTMTYSFDFNTTDTIPAGTDVSTITDPAVQQELIDSGLVNEDLTVASDVRHCSGTISVDGTSYPVDIWNDDSGNCVISGDLNADGTVSADEVFDVEFNEDGTISFYDKEGGTVVGTSSDLTENGGVYTGTIV